MGKSSFTFMRELTQNETKIEIKRSFEMVHSCGNFSTFVKNNFFFDCQMYVN